MYKWLVSHGSRQRTNIKQWNPESRDLHLYVSLPFFCRPWLFHSHSHTFVTPCYDIRCITTAGCMIFSFHTTTFVSNINQSLSIRCSDHIKCFGNIIKASCFTNGSFKPWIALLMLVLLHFDSFFFYRPSSLTLSSSWSSISPPISHPQTYKTAVHSSSRSAFSSFSLSFSSPTRFLLPYKTPLLRYKLISLQRERKYKRHTQNIYITFTYTYHTSRYISRYDDLHNAQAEQCHPGQNTCIGSQHECTYFSITKSLLLVWFNKAYVIRLPIVRINIDENDWTWQSFANNKSSSSIPFHSFHSYPSQSRPVHSFFAGQN